MTSSGKETRSWSESDVPDQSGRVAVVTGANTGIEYHTAAVLAFRGAHVVLAVRNLEKGNAALSRIVAACPTASSSSAATRSSSSPARNPTTRSCNVGSGPCPKNSPASASRFSGSIMAGCARLPNINVS